MAGEELHPETTISYSLREMFDRLHIDLKSMGERLGLLATKADVDSGLAQLHKRIDGVESRVERMELEDARDDAVRSAREHSSDRKYSNVSLFAASIGTAALVLSVIIGALHL